MLVAIAALLMVLVPSAFDNAPALTKAANAEYADIVDKYLAVNSSERVSLLRRTESETLPNILNVLVWNIHKADGGDNFEREFHMLSHRKNLILVQEGIENPFFSKIMSRETKQSWVFAKSFLTPKNMEATGVVSGASANPVRFLGAESPDRESFFPTPKITLASTYKLANGSNLLVVNIHGINFVANSAFRRHVDLWIPWLKAFKGKAIFAGDFNTWNIWRLNYIREKMLEAGFIFANPGDDTRSFQLDHIFVKGCSIVSANIENWAVGSDHKPVTAKLDCSR